MPDAVRGSPELRLGLRECRGIGVKGFRFGAWGLGFGVWGLGFRVGGDEEV